MDLRLKEVTYSILVADSPIALLTTASLRRWFPLKLGLPCCGYRTFKTAADLPQESISCPHGNFWIRYKTGGI